MKPNHKSKRTAVLVTLLIQEIACANGVKKYVEMAIKAVFSNLSKCLLACSSESLCSAVCTDVQLLTYELFNTVHVCVCARVWPNPGPFTFAMPAEFEVVGRK